MHLCHVGDGGIDESPAEHGRRQNPPPFLEKTYMLLEDPDTDDVVSWTEDGSSFVVWKPAEFSRDVLPSLFKHSNFSSFVRQLNTYGFRKASTTRWEFCNNMFKRGHKSLMSSIYRRKGWSAAARRQLLCDAPGCIPSGADERTVAEGSPSPSSSSEYTTLVDENKRLRSQNGALCSELSDVKRKFQELIDIVVSVNRAPIGCDMVERDVDVHVGPMLFGVRLVPHGGGKSGEKKNRVGIGEPLQFLLSPSS